MKELEDKNRLENMNNNENILYSDAFYYGAITLERLHKEILTKKRD